MSLPGRLLMSTKLPLVLVEMLGLLAAQHQQVGGAVVVDVAEAGPGGILLGGRRAGGVGDQLEREASILGEPVAVEGVVFAGAVGDIDVEVAVAVEVEKGDARGAVALHRVPEEQAGEAGAAALLQRHGQRLGGRRLALVGDAVLGGGEIVERDPAQRLRGDGERRGVQRRGRDGRNEGSVHGPGLLKE